MQAIVCRSILPLAVVAVVAHASTRADELASGSAYASVATAPAQANEVPTATGRSLADFAQRSPYESLGMDPPQPLSLPETPTPASPHSELITPLGPQQIDPMVVAPGASVIHPSEVVVVPPVVGPYCEACNDVNFFTPDHEWQVDFFGALSLELIHSQAGTTIPSAILFLNSGKSSTEVHAKSTHLGAAFQGPRLWGMQARGLFLSYLYGNSLVDDEYGLYIARMYGELIDHERRFLVGVERDVVSPLTPNTVNFGQGYGAGNIGFFRAQLRYERYVHHAANRQVTWQFALSDPYNEVFADQGLDSEGWPNIEGRVALGLGQRQARWGGRNLRNVEVGVSSVLGQLERGNQEVDVWGVGVDVEIPFSERSGIRGEFYTGQALGNYNGGVLYSVNGTGSEVRSTGGWVEAYYYWSPCLHSHFGYTLDDPSNNNVSFGQPGRNRSVFANVFWDFRENWELAFELSDWETRYRTSELSGVAFHTRLQRKF